MKTLVTAVLTLGLAAVLCVPAGAAQFPTGFEEAGVRFKLRGQAPLKARVFFTVCNVALYLTPYTPKDEVLTDVPKALELVYNYEITPDQFAESAAHALKKNLSPAELGRITQGVRQIDRLYRKVEKGDRYRLLYIPGRGTSLSLNGNLLGTVQGRDFGIHYFKIWLGKDPVDDGMRDELLQPDRVEPRPEPQKETTMTDAENSKTVYSFDVASADGETVSLDAYKEKVLLIVNVASKCGFTKQYDGLQKLHETYKDRGFSVLGFPCNQFGSQEPGTDEEIQEFCTVNFGVTFPVFAKVDVNGDDAHPLYVFLKAQAPGILGSESIKWNFTKFLVDRNGKVVDRFGSKTKPEDLKDRIEELLDVR